jgi:hypothetical protein
MHAANDNKTLTADQAAAATAQAVIGVRIARGEKVAQSIISEAVRAAAVADMDAQFVPRKWERA